MTLKATTETLKLITTAAVPLDYHINYADLTTTATDGTSEVLITTATTTTILSAPASSTQRIVLYASFVNRHGSSTQTFVIQKDISGTVYTLTPIFVLNYGEMVTFAKGVGWQKFNRDGDLILVGATGATGATGPAGSGSDNSDYNNIFLLG